MKPLIWKPPPRVLCRVHLVSRVKSVRAFGFQGQKCSAGSRAIIVGSVYDQVVGRVVELTKKLSIAAPDSGPKVDQGPVIEPDAFKRILNYIEIGASEGKILTGGHAIETESSGYFIEPTVIGDVPWDARVAQEEIFGPVLSIIRAADFDDALRIANSTEYGLTGAVFSQDRARLERARQEFNVGNLYFNLTSATCTSTANAPGRWSVCIPSADST